MIAIYIVSGLKTWLKNLKNLFLQYRSCANAVIIPFILVCSIGTLYWLTMPKTLSWGWRGYGIDSPELITAAKYFSVPHPPGYPFYTVMLGLFSNVFAIGDYALRGNLFSLILSCLCVLVTYMIGESLLRHLYPTNHNINTRIVAFLGAITLAVAPIYWSVSVVTEVYTLHCLLVAIQVYLGILLILKWHLRKQVNSILLTCLFIAFAIGLSNHLTILAFTVPIVAVLLFNVPLRLLVRPVPLLIASIFLLIYLYLPLRSSAEVPFNWGDSSNVQGFLWMLRAAPYQDYVMAAPISELDDRTLIFVKFIFDQFNVIGLFFTAVGIKVLVTKNKPLILMVATTFLLLFVYSITYLTVDAEVNFIPVFIYFSICSSIGIMEIFKTVQKSVQNIGEKHGKFHLPILVGILTFVLYFAFVPGFNSVSNYEELDFSKDEAALKNGRDILANVSAKDILIVSSEKDVFTSWYAIYTDSEVNTGIPIAEPLLVYDWYIKRAVLTEFPSFEKTYSSNDILDVISEIIEHSDRRGSKVFTIRPIVDDRFSLDMVSDGMYLLANKVQE